LKQCFFAYDANKSGALEKEEAFAYINDLLSIGDLAENIKKEGIKEGLDAEEYYSTYIENIYVGMDINQDGVIEFDELLKPKYDEVREFLNAVSLRTLRAHKNPNPKSSRKRTSRSMRDSKKESVKSSREFKKNSSRKASTRTPRDSRKKKEKKAEEEIIEWLPGDDAFEVNDEEVEAPKPQARNALTQSGLISLRSDTVQNVSEIMGISSQKAQSLLSRFKWDQQELLEAYYADPEKVCNELGITMEEKSEIIIDLPEEIECSVCFDFTSEYTYLASCGHMFCNACWGDSLSVNINSGNVTELHCMSQGCREILGDNDIKKLVTNDLWKKYSQFLSNKFVDNSGSVKWCPRPGCTIAIAEPLVEGDNFIGVCSCGYKFCWKCNQKYHSPATCQQVESWSGKENSEDLLNLRWMQQNTKQCPKCHYPIQKNDGCFAMTCSQCRAQFCWLCRQDWSTHSNHFACSKYTDGVLENRPQFRDGEKKIHFTKKMSKMSNIYFSMKDTKHINHLLIMKQI
jgi:hypothetical protein